MTSHDSLNVLDLFIQKKNFSSVDVWDEGLPADKLYYNLIMLQMKRSDKD